MDYIMRSNLSLSLFFGTISTYQETDGEYFLGFSQSGIFHHKARKSFSRSRFMKLMIW
jgi:hypothetical protein